MAFTVHEKDEYTRRLGRIIESEGITQARFAADLKISLSSLKGWLQGTRGVSVECVDRIANHPRYSPWTTYLLTGKDEIKWGE